MRKVPSQVLLFLFLFTVVLCSSVNQGGPSGAAKPSDVLAPGYTAPVVTPGSEDMFILVLKKDLRMVDRETWSADHHDTVTADLCRQSYNNIAPQLDPRLLDQNSLPHSLR